MDSQFATTFLSAFNARFIQRRNVDAASMVAFLNGKSKNEVQFLEYSDENKKIENCKLFYERIYPEKAGWQVNDFEGVKFN